MALDKLVDSAQLDADLTSVADAIRTKGGTSAALAFPVEFISAIMAIPTAAERRFSGSLINFNIASKAYLDSLVVQINPVQSGSGDPSPSNVRPISGFNAADIYVSPTTDPDDGATYTIDLDGTRYGGTLDVLTGVLIVDRIMLNPQILNRGKANNAGDGRIFYMSASDTSGAAGDGQEFMSNYLSPRISSAYEGLAVNEYRSNPNASTICICAPGADLSKADMLTWYSANNIQFCYKLKETKKQTVQLTPQQVKLLTGENNIWSDTNGDVTVEYTEIST